MNVSDQQVLEAQGTFWSELRHWRILPFRAAGSGTTHYKAVRDQNIGEEPSRFSDQDTEDGARGVMQFFALKAAIQSINLDECPDPETPQGAEPPDSPPAS